MPDQYKVAAFAKTFEKLYQTIGVRTALIRHEGQWRPICIALRMYLAPESTVRRRFQSLESRYGKMQSQRFRVAQHCYPFSELERLADAFRAGHLMLEGLDVRFDAPKDILGVSGNIPRASEPTDKPVIMNWLVLRGSVELLDWRVLHQVLQSDPEILCDAEVAGYSNPYSVVKQLLEVDFDSSTRRSYLWLESDVPARIDSVKASRDRGGIVTLKVHITAHQALSNLSCNIRAPWSGHPLLQQKVLALRQSKGKDGLRAWSGQIELNPGVDDVDVELIYKGLGRLSSEGIRPSGLLPTEERNPLFVALTRFCSLEQVKALLEHPAAIQISGNVNQVALKNKGRLYEVSTQWLLACLGFRAVWLHGYEKMEKDKFDHGSIDCIAYHESKNVLLLVNCTTGPPDSHELDRQSELQHLLSEEVFHNTAVRLYSVVFTASHRPKVGHGTVVHRDIPIFYQEDIPNLLNLIRIGREMQFLNAIASPSFSALQ